MFLGLLQRVLIKHSWLYWYMIIVTFLMIPKYDKLLEVFLIRNTATWGAQSEKSSVCLCVCVY